MKIDVTLIEGYENMSAEEKLKALEGFDIPEPDYSGYVKKDLYDKAAHELAAKKKELKDRLSDDEQKKLEQEQMVQELQQNYDKLLRESNISKHKAKLIGLGYEEALAEETATALADGDSEKVFVNQQKHLKTFEKKIRAEALKQTPKPLGDGDPDTMTLEKLRKLSPQERYEYSTKNPQEYEALYTGGNE